MAKIFGASVGEVIQVSSTLAGVSMKMDGKVVAELVADRMKQGAESSLTSVIPTLSSGGK
jgi:hypothetical protein